MGLDITIHKFAHGTLPVVSYSNQAQTDVCCLGADWKVYTAVRNASNMQDINEVFIPLGEDLLAMLITQLASHELEALTNAMYDSLDTQEDLYIRATF